MKIIKYVACQLGGIREIDSKCNIFKMFNHKGKITYVFKGICKNCKHGIKKDMQCAKKKTTIETLNA